MSTNTATVTADPWGGPEDQQFDGHWLYWRRFHRELGLRGAHAVRLCVLYGLWPHVFAGCVPLIGVIYYLVIRKKIGE